MAVTIGTTADYLASIPRRRNIQLGGYFFSFWRNSTTGYMVYKSSSNGTVWSNEANASHAAITDYAYNICVFCNGTNILIMYYVGAQSSGNPNAVTIYTRKGTQSGGTISWDSQVTVRNAAGWCSFSIAKTSTQWYISLIAYNTTTVAYHIHVYKSSDATSWTEILNSTTMTDEGVMAGQAIARWPEYSDGIILVAGKYSQITYIYRTYNGSTWGTDALTFGEKNSSAYSTEGFSLATYGSKVYCCYQPVGASPLPIRFRTFVTSWSGYVTLDSETSSSVSLSAHSSFLFLFYLKSGIIYKNFMNYSTEVWSGAISWISGESSPNGPNSEQYPLTSNIAVTWRAGSSPYSVRFSFLGLITSQSCLESLNCLGVIFFFIPKLLVEEISLPSQISLPIHKLIGEILRLSVNQFTGIFFFESLSLVSFIFPGLIPRIRKIVKLLYRRLS